ncbi:DUF883 domain-containing protein [Pseudomonas cavernae]|uniref:DUF883 domain-containing protein n=1 Tax=Pseudomonas cavernae TaxID=2320867 RepID=A0A385YX99_9PSED|nr:DUF883 family protein [Pseudomonas cavernae]AYC30890.1 DUF883 domain-containing protein [Pseudomonas cavernae]
MALFASRTQSLRSLETEIEQLIAALESFKDGASGSSAPALRAIKARAENALGHSRELLGEAYRDMKDKTYQAGAATRDYGREHPLASAGLMLGVVGLIGYLYYSNHRG